MEQAEALLQDALHFIRAAKIMADRHVKDALAQAAAAAASTATAELRRYLQPNPTPTTPLLDCTPVEPCHDTEEDCELLQPTPSSQPAGPTPPPRPYQDFVAAMVPILRAESTDTQQVHITRIGRLWQRHKNSANLSAAIAAATEEVRAGRERSLSSESSV